MGDIINCPNCHSIFRKNAFREVCDTCFKDEERQFNLVYNFIRQRQNRTATLLQVTNATGVSEALIYKFIKQKRLQISQFPNLGYPCEQCGELIQTGKICGGCQARFNKELSKLKEAEQRQQHPEVKTNRTYHTFDGGKKEL
ncbi:TIGR03826 family flagellar region protein [Bacillus sp. CGMCC 1.16541]|uniref:TIGR03826 family flagellar region protein n=1 Tax=Bacillus sp. CGMCC 1.16541 TaxID=2185143 RepID=UPI000D7335DE|nr:TIGR03826 family flagellar region protein [Bacillus sp. CGMCC 1.16541]